MLAKGTFSSEIALEFGIWIIFRAGSNIFWLKLLLWNLKNASYWYRLSGNIEWRCEKKLIWRKINKQTKKLSWYHEICNKQKQVSSVCKFSSCWVIHRYYLSLQLPSLEDKFSYFWDQWDHWFTLAFILHPFWWNSTVKASVRISDDASSTVYLFFLDLYPRMNPILFPKQYTFSVMRANNSS